MNRWMMIVATVLALVLSPEIASAEDGPRVRLTMRYVDITDSEPGPQFERFLYPEVGFSFLNEYLFVDANTPMMIALFDAFAALVGFLGGGSGDLPVMEGLNPGEREPGSITIFELAGGPQVARFGDLHFGVGAHFEYSWQFPYFGDERVNISPVDFGAMGHAWYDGDDVDMTLGIAVGNGWHRFGAFNPFFNVSTATEFHIGDVFSIYASGRVQMRQVSYEDYEPPFPTAPPPSEIRGTTEHISWALEFGPSFRF